MALGVGLASGGAATAHHHLQPILGAAAASPVRKKVKKSVWGTGVGGRGKVVKGQGNEDVDWVSIPSAPPTAPPPPSPVLLPLSLSLKLVPWKPFAPCVRT